MSEKGKTLMLYCEDCAVLYEDRCPFCRKRKGREPKNDDLCFFNEKSSLMASIQEDLLQQEGIPFVRRVASGVSPYLGENMTRYRYYTRYDLLDKVHDLLPEADQ